MSDLPNGWGNSNNVNPWANKQKPSVPDPQKPTVTDAGAEPALTDETTPNGVESESATPKESSLTEVNSESTLPDEVPIIGAESDLAPDSTLHIAPSVFPVSQPPQSEGEKKMFLLPAACILGTLLLGGVGLLLGKHFAEQHGDDDAARTVLEQDTTPVLTTVYSDATTTVLSDTTEAMITENALISFFTEQTFTTTTTVSQSIVTSLSIVTITEAPARSATLVQSSALQTQAPPQTQASATTQTAEAMPVIEPKPVKVEYDLNAVPFMPDPNAAYETWSQAYMNCLHTIIQSHPGDSFFQTENENNMGYMFDLVDVSRDGIPELFISSGPFHMADLWMYSFDNGNRKARSWMMSSCAMNV